MATKRYESMRIMSLEGSMLCKGDVFTATKDGKPDLNAFRSILDESLDTLKLAEIYESYGNRNVLNGYRVTDGDIEDLRLQHQPAGTSSLITISSM